jgi:hypothetical protein
MRYRLRTLLIAATLGPPVLALLWFVGIWARFHLPDIILTLVRPLFLPGMAASLILTLYALLALPPGSKPAVTLAAWQYVALWAAQFLAQWHWFMIVIGLGGWLFVWGDRGPPFSESAMAITAGGMAGISACITCLRISTGQATVTYVVTILCLVAPLFNLAVLFWLARWLR